MEFNEKANSLCAGLDSVASLGDGANEVNEA